jgi:KTSC domain
MAFEILPLHDSDAIAEGAYDREGLTLRITYKPNAPGRAQRVYHYFDVPEDIVEEFVSAESHGTFLNWEIKPRYSCKEMV